MNCDQPTACVPVLKVDHPRSVSGGAALQADVVCNPDAVQSCVPQGCVPRYFRCGGKRFDVGSFYLMFIFVFFTSSSYLVEFDYFIFNA